MEVFLIVLLAVILMASTAFQISAVYGLIVWLVLIVIYSIRCGCGLKRIFHATCRRMSSVAKVLINLALIGMLSATLRDCGCITFVVSIASNIKSAIIILPATFLLCSAMSVCIGSAFASTASVGIICVTIARTLNIPDAIICGAIFSGVYVGDRISPVSSSAVLVSELSGYNIHANIGAMLKRFPVPFLATFLLYTVLGLFLGKETIAPATLPDTPTLICLLPIVLILALSLLKVKSIITLAIASLSAIVIAISTQKLPLADTIRSLYFGYEASTPDMTMLNGGGIVSMLKPIIIIAIATCYIAIFDETGFLKPVSELLNRIRLESFSKSILIAVIASVIAGSQTLAIVLSSILTDKSLSEKESAAALEDTAITIPAIVPWSTAYAAPAAMLTAPLSCLLFAFYLYLIPLYGFICSKRKVKTPVS